MERTVNEIGVTEYQTRAEKALAQWRAKQQERAEKSLVHWQKETVLRKQGVRELDALLPVLDEYCPRRRELAWSTSRHRASLAAGILCSAAVGFLVGVAEAVGLALGRAVARRPLIVFPALLVFVLVLAAQTYVGGAALSLALIGTMVFRAAWVSTITALAGAVVYGMWKNRKEK